MEPTLLAKIAIRLLAVYSIVQGMIGIVGNIGLVFSKWFADSMQQQGLSAVVVGAFVIFAPIILGGLLWVFSGKLSVLIVGSKAADQKPSVHHQLNSLNLQAVAISTVGCLIVLLEIPNLIQLLVRLAQISENIHHLGYPLDLTLALMVSVMKIALGLLLVLGIKFWVRTLHNLRMFGLKKKSDW